MMCSVIGAVKINAAVLVVLLSHYQDPGNGGQPTSSPGGDQVYHAVCHRLLWRVQRGGFVPDDRPSRTTASNGSIWSKTRNNLKVCFYLCKVWQEDGLWHFLLVWLLSNCSNHDQNAEQRQVLESHEWDGDHWKQVGRWRLVPLLPSAPLSDSGTHSGDTFKQTRLCFDPVYTATWLSTWTLRLCWEPSVTSTWLWTGYAPLSSTSELLKTPHTMVRVENVSQARVNY